MSYTCPKCGAVSYNPNDEANGYCGACHAFEEDLGWLVWSFEHAAWWGPGKCGYTPDLNKAGRYTRLEALEICENANRYSKEVNEAMVHQSKLRKAADELGDTFLDCREENWDGYNAQTVPDEAYLQAKALLWQVLGVFPLPSLSANPSGSLTLEWSAAPSRRLIVSINGEQLLAFAGLFGSETVQGTTSFVDDFPLELFLLLKRLYYL